MIGPPPSRGRDLELEGGVNACHVEYVYTYTSPETSTCEIPSNEVVEISHVEYVYESRDSYMRDTE